MTRPAHIASFLSLMFVVACGGGAPAEPPPGTSPAPESKPTPPAAEVAAPLPNLAAPPNTVGPALTPPPGTGAISTDQAGLSAAARSNTASSGETSSPALSESVGRVEGKLGEGEKAGPPGTRATVAEQAPEKPAFTRTDLQVGKGREATKGKGLSVHYTGWLYDPSRPDLKGRMFDSSRERGPFNFVLGAGQVIPGWDDGFVGMKVGGRRRLIIPPHLAYGVDGAGSGIIPPNATLIFEMELLDVRE
jgi:FKBP-type peptidyl-prolyl cis-trans isomerase FkpA